MGRRLLHLYAALTGVAGLSLTLLISFADATQISATPTTSACGSPISAWGPGIVDDVQIGLNQLKTSAESETIGKSLPQGTPEAAVLATHFAEIEIVNTSNTVVHVVVNDIALILCDGTVLTPVPIDHFVPLADGQILAGDVRTGWVAFAIPDGGVPERLVVPIRRPGFAGGRVEFPLVDPNATIAAGASPGTRGGTGADAIGADAIGGDGADGADATAENSQ